jgi:cytochrome c553
MIFSFFTGGFSSPLNAQKKEEPSSKLHQEPDKRKLSIKFGRGKAQLCTRCHGRLGMLKAVKGAEFKGSVEGFVIKELIDFRKGVRSHAVMNSIAQTLSDKDINDIAAWYNAISIRP